MGADPTALMPVPSPRRPPGAAPAARAPLGDRYLVAGLAVTQIVSWGVLYYGFSVLLVPMQRDLGWSRGVLVGGFTTAVVVSALVAPAVGRHLDAADARALMAGGGAAGAAFVALWAASSTVATYYAAWIGIGAVMAATLYEPAFTVLAKRRAPHHRRAITAVTLVAGLASFVFQPVTAALADAHGWRTALVVLAGILAAVTVPVHLVVLRRPANGGLDTDAPPPAAGADRRFWTMTAAFSAVAVTSFATSVLLIAHLVDAGWDLGRAALAGGVLGASQLLGRLAFGPMSQRLPLAVVAPVLFLVPGLGVLALLAAGGGPFVWAAAVVLGTGQGATTLLRPTLFVDLYGTDRIGVLNGLAATPITLARALAPLGAALVVSATGGYGVTFVLLAAVSLTAAVIARTALADL
jgi:predicted MFS family arabinose efflux permease